MSLKVYQRKRKFSQTPEPRGKVKRGKGSLQFVVQLHQASRLHYDFRLEFDGVYKSWAVPKGPSLNPMDQRLAVFVEDHPIDYGTFEGIIPKGNYGAGTVMVWDKGKLTERSSNNRKESELALKKGLEKGHITFLLDGEKLKGEFALIKLGKSDAKAWLLVKKRDAFSNYKDVTRQNLSVKTGRSLEQIASQSEKKGDVWLSKRGFEKASSTEKKVQIKRALEKTSVPKKSAKISVMPRRLKPLIPVSSKELGGGTWLFESDLEGLRAVAELDGRTVHLYSRSLLPFEKKYPAIVDDLKAINAKMILDGEIVIKGKKSSYWIYDILYHDGKDLRETPLSERKKILEKAIKASTHVHVQKYALAPEKVAGKKGALILAKDADSSYHSGISKSWVRIESTSKISPLSTSREEPRLTHLDKIMFPDDGFTKGDLIEYYRSISSYILPYLKDRPESLNRFPNGIHQTGFYQKDMTGYIPRFLKTQRIYSESNDKSVDYAVCQDERSLLYLINLGCIELNPWFSRIDHLDKPDFMVIDLDPDDNPFKQVVEIAKDVHKVLDDIGAPNFCKTSGATGIHICVPLKGKYEFDPVRIFSEEVCKVVNKKHPSSTSIQRNPDRRRKKIYLDFMQNRRGQTLAAPYSVRPRDGAPVSMPLKWSELTQDLKPEDFHMKNALQRLRRVGDLWKPVIEMTADIEKCSRLLRRKYG